MPKMKPGDAKLVAGTSGTSSPPGGGGPPPVTVTGSPPSPPPVTVTGSPPTGGSPPGPVTGSPPSSGPDHNPYSPSFDCASATQQQKNEHNQLDSIKRLANGIHSMGPGDPGGQTGYDNQEYIGFSWRTPQGQNEVSTLAAGGPNSVQGYTFVQSTPGGPYDTIRIGGQDIPINQLTSVTHNHPSNSANGNATLQSEYPLPSPSQPGDQPGTYKGDYPNAKQLLDLGAPASLLMGIYAEAKKGEGYQVRTYKYQDPPPYNSNDPSTYAPAYGPVVPDLVGC